ncbi:hypothetical protein FB451DRAFT_1569799 [Mycena latifolia]|nr:hypothetical protein FB451DRAFT_1569799 [Mycena latifolia]
MAARMMITRAAARRPAYHKYAPAVLTLTCYNITARHRFSATHYCLSSHFHFPLAGMALPLDSAANPQSQSRGARAAGHAAGGGGGDLALCGTSAPYVVCVVLVATHTPLPPPAGLLDGCHSLERELLVAGRERACTLKADADVDAKIQRYPQPPDDPCEIRMRAHDVRRLESAVLRDALDQIAGARAERARVSGASFP